MNPLNVPSRDFALYYNNTYMLHAKRGPVYVTARDGVLLARKNPSQNYRNTDPAMLECLFPIPRAINYRDGAVQIARRSTRSARRSATLAHYYVLWSEYAPPDGIDGINAGHMSLLLTPLLYPLMGTAFDMISQGGQRSVAVSKDFILSAEGVGAVNIRCHGRMVGEIIRESNGYRYEPLEADPLMSARTEFKLQKEGLLCL
jgi:hypothetical protein